MWATLAARVARPGGNGHAAQALRAEVDAQTAREQAVARHILEDVVPAHAYHMHTAGHEISPGVDVVLGMADSHGRARGAAGAVHAHDFRGRHAQQPRGILGAQILLAGERDASQIVQAADGIRADARFVQALAVKGAFARLG